MHPDFWASSKAKKKEMWKTVMTVLKHPKEQELVDQVLARCTTRRIFFDHGMSIALLAGEEVREKFRRALVRRGAIRQAMLLAEMTHTPLTHKEIIAIGNAQEGELTKEEAAEFLAYAEAVEGVEPHPGVFSLTMGRLRRQFVDKLARL